MEFSFRKSQAVFLRNRDRGNSSPGNLLAQALVNQGSSKNWTSPLTVFQNTRTLPLLQQKPKDITHKLAQQQEQHLARYSSGSPAIACLRLTKAGPKNDVTADPKGMTSFQFGRSSCSRHLN
jgi:hypothetical protein